MGGKALVLTLILGALASSAPAADERIELPPIQLTDQRGHVFEVKDFVGAVTVLNFWAFWCGPCRAELPELQKLYNDLGRKGLAVIAVAVDTPPEMVQPFMDRVGVSLPVAFMDKRTQMELGIDRIPYSILLDRSGKVVRAYPGYAPAIIVDLREQVGKLLAEPKKQGGK